MKRTSVQHTHTHTHTEKIVQRLPGKFLTKCRQNAVR